MKIANSPLTTAYNQKCNDAKYNNLNRQNNVIVNRSISNNVQNKANPSFNGLSAMMRHFIMVPAVLFSALLFQGCSSTTETIETIIDKEGIDETITGTAKPKGVAITDFQDHFIRDIAKQSDVAPTNDTLKGQEIDYFKEMIQKAVECNLTTYPVVNEELGRIVGMDSRYNDAYKISAENNGKDILYTFKHNRNLTENQQYMIKSMIKNLNPLYIDNFMAGYTKAIYSWYNEAVNTLDEKMYSDAEKRKYNAICGQVVKYCSESYAKNILKILCYQVLKSREYFGDTNTSEYKTLKEILDSNKDIIEFAEDGVLDQLIESITGRSNVPYNAIGVYNFLMKELKNQ